jgi:hypothetical protein
MNVHVNTFFPECVDRQAGAIAAHPPALEAVAEARRPARRERHASCYYWNRRRYTDGRNLCPGSGRSVRGGYGMAVKRDRDYHAPHGGTIERCGPDTPRRSPGEARSPGDSPCRIVEAIYPVSHPVHLSVRPFGSGQHSYLRPFCGMTAEITENLTLSRAHACGDSPWSLEGRSLGAPWGPAIRLSRMRLAAIRFGNHRMGYAIREAFWNHCIIY